MFGKILIVDDVSTNRIVFKVKLAAAGYETIMAGDGASCIRMAISELPDLILLDYMLPDVTGIDVLAQLKSDPRTRRIPVVMFSSEHDAASRVAAVRAGAEDFLSRPIDDQMLLARLRGLLRARGIMGGLSAEDDSLGLFAMAEPASNYERPGQIALVLNSPEIAVSLRKKLAAHGPDRYVILGAEDVFSDRNGLVSPDVYLIDADFSAPGSGLRLMSELLSRTASRNAAFCIHNHHSQTLVPAMAFDLGANDLVDAAISPSELAVRLHALVLRKRETDQMRASMQDGLRMAMIDPLTGLHNRRYGIAQLTAIANRAAAQRTEFAVMILDLDRFKSINDRWGHAAGDAVLIEVATRLATNLRGSDLLARIGGEEFLIALPSTAFAEAEAVARRLCRATEMEPIVLADGTQIRVTISIGMTFSAGMTDVNGACVPDIVDQADKALMRSKAAGRNQVTIVHNAA